MVWDRRAPSAAAAPSWARKRLLREDGQRHVQRRGKKGHNKIGVPINNNRMVSQGGMLRVIYTYEHIRSYVYITIPNNVLKLQ